MAIIGERLEDKVSSKKIQVDIKAIGILMNCVEKYTYFMGELKLSYVKVAKTTLELMYVWLPFLSKTI